MKSILCAESSATGEESREDAWGSRRLKLLFPQIRHLCFSLVR